MSRPNGDGAASGHGIEFVLDGEQDVPVRPPGVVPGRAWSRFLPLAGFVALAIIVLGAARLTASSPSSTVPAIGPSTAPVVAQPRDPRDCRRGAACTTRPDVPNAVYRAVADALPGARPNGATTVISSDGLHLPVLWFRVVQSGTAKLDVTVQVTQTRPSDRTVETRDPDGIGRVVTTVATRAHQLRVQVVVTTNDASPPPPFAVLRRLAADRRLTLLQ